MKNLRFHLIYLVIISFLTYQYWIKAQALEEAVRSIEGFDKLIRNNNEVVNKSSIMIKNEIEKNVHAYASPPNMLFLKRAENIMLASNQIYNWLDKQKLEFSNFTGGYNKEAPSVLANRLSSKASDLFFSEQKIREINDSLTRFQTYLDDISDTVNLHQLQKLYVSRNLTNNNVFWKSLRNKTNADALAQLSSIQNQIELDKIPYLNYLYNIVGWGGWGFNQFKVAIAPKKAVLIDGEKFEMDAYLTHYSSNPGPYVTFWVNDKEISPKEGFAHFEKLETTVGKKTVKAEVRIKNPLSGQITTTIGVFEYEVLPKCAKNCQ